MGIHSPRFARGFPNRLGAGMILSASALAVVGPGQAETPGIPPGYQLVWSDEFNQGRMPDPDKWAYDTSRNKKGWWNGELQYYSDARGKNSRIEDGVLIIEAHRETLSADSHPDWGGQQYTSARLLTRGKESWTYGYFEVRAKLACGRGTWSAIWTLPDPPGDWPDDGEIDFMEYVGHDPGKVHASVHTRDYNHTKKTQKTSAIVLNDPCREFHVYSLHWTPDAIIVAVDGKDYYVYENNGEGYGAWPFDRSHHLILNLAIGGWGAMEGIDDDIFPARYEIDYVRIWQKP